MVAAAYGRQDIRFGPEYLIPPPFDPRLITTVAPAVAEAAMRSGVATRPIADLKAYRHSLERYVYTSGTVMQPVFQAAADGPTRRIVYAEGEDDRVLRAAQVAVDERLARPVLVGRPEVIAGKITDLGLRLGPEQDYDLASFDDAEMIDRAAEQYYGLGKRQRPDAGLRRRRDAPEQHADRRRCCVRDGQADGMLCGTSGPYASHLKYVREAIGLRADVNDFAAMHLLMLPGQTVFICDTYINPEPTAAQLADMTMLAAEAVRRFGLEPRVALLSHSSFGSADTPSARKMREALTLIRTRAPSSRSTARCTRTPRSRSGCSIRPCRFAPDRARRTS